MSATAEGVLARALSRRGARSGFVRELQPPAAAPPQAGSTALPAGASVAGAAGEGLRMVDDGRGAGAGEDVLMQDAGAGTLAQSVQAALAAARAQQP